MRFKSFCILMGIGLAFADVPSLEARTGQNQSISVSKEMDAKDSYSNTRWIGLRSKGSDRCPKVKGWTEEDLLGRVVKRLCPLQVAADDMTLIRHLGLDRVCIYSTDAEKDFVAPPGMVAQRDRMALSGHADPLEQRVWPILEKHFLDQAGKSSLRLKGGPRVRLAFIDSQPDGEDLPSKPPGGSQHGYTLAHLSKRLVCPTANDSCAAKVVTRRALQHSRFKPDEPLQPLPASVGGHLGTISELAEAIVAEVLHWRKEDDHENLILNLSIGWDGELALLNGPADLQTSKATDLEPSVQAVYKALQFAKKKNVLVITAAGNRRGGQPKSVWPLLPAAWELRRPSFLPFAFGDKLVYAVGGVDRQGLPLPNSRSGGHPRRAAYGDHAVTAVGNLPTAIYTGSSVSAAVVSSVAAVVWHLRPELRPDQVMALIDKSGKDLDVRASFYPGSKGFLSSLLPAPKLRRISLCTAVKHACGPGTVQCPALASTPRCPAYDRPPSEIAHVLASLTAIDPPLYQLASPTPAFIPPCEPVTRLWTGNGQVPANPCPTEQFSSVSNQRWVFPQPDDPPCPSCSVYSKPPREAALTPEALTLPPQEYALAIEISPEWCQSAGLVSATLDIDCFEQGVFASRMTYPIDVCPSTGEPWSVPGLGHRQSLLGCRAQLNFVVEKDGKTMSIQNPVVVEP